MLNELNQLDSLDMNSTSGSLAIKEYHSFYRFEAYYIQSTYRLGGIMVFMQWNEVLVD